ncbi:cell division protein FtsQ/DivIB [Emticicia sp. 17c]|uniref:cell division protein FtsQ/DivIB n=1 Tax=Emticicia sp. 17c TaxID=3127704 RepID=UPI00301C0205
MDKKNNFKKIGKWVMAGSALIAVVVLVVFSSNTFSAERCKKIEVKIKNANEQFFIDTKEIENLATRNGSTQLVGELFEKIDLREIEKRILKNKQVKTCQAFRGIEGNLNIDIEQHIPVARILMNNGREDVYVDKEGAFFPLSERYSARIILLSGEYFRNLPSLKLKRQEKLLNFINLINDDTFLKAQFTQLEIDKTGNINIVPLLGKHTIEFGEPENVQNRLNRLKIFYKHILPVQGWDTFTSVSVKYDGQVVCK